MLLPAYSRHQYRHIFCKVGQSANSYSLLSYFSFCFSSLFSCFYKTPLSPKPYSQGCLVDTSISSLIHTDHEVLYKAATKLLNPMSEVGKQRHRQTNSSTLESKPSAQPSRLLCLDGVSTSTGLHKTHAFLHVSLHYKYYQSHQCSDSSYFNIHLSLCNKTGNILSNSGLTQA